MTFVFFFTGATGYIGGTVLARFLAELESQDSPLNDYKVRVLVRSEVKEKALSNWLYLRNWSNLVDFVIGSLDDIDLLEKEAARADAVIDTADCDHLAGVTALVKGICKSKNTLFLHTSGCSALLDEEHGNHLNPKVYHDDSPDDIASIPSTAPHRDVDEMINRMTGGLNVATISPPLIWGCGVGLHIHSFQSPYLTQRAIENRQAYHDGRGISRWCQIHVWDLAVAYWILFKAMLSEPKRHNGFYFCENGEFEWKFVTQAIQEGLIVNGLAKPNSKSLDADEKTRKEKLKLPIGGVAPDFVVSGNSRNKAVLLRNLGWEPQYSSMQSFRDWLVTEVAIMLEEELHHH